MKKVSLNVMAISFPINSDLPQKHRKCHATRCMCITCKKPNCGTCLLAFQK